MPQYQQSSQRRAQGGGRKANSEPKLQVFRDFAGIDFQHANQFANGIDIDTEHSGGDQTDLQMNYVFLQNNVMVASNKTLETRNEIVELFNAPSGVTFTGPVCLIGPKLYVARSDQQIGVADLDSRASAGSPQTITEYVDLHSYTGGRHDWTSLDYYDDKLIALTSQNDMWTGDVSNCVVSSEGMSNALQVPDPEDTSLSILDKGSLHTSGTMSEACPYRIQIAFTYVNKYGPTLPSVTHVIYADHPISEWHAGCYLQLGGDLPIARYGVKAVELYYSADNAFDLLFLGRVDVTPGQSSWTYNWLGYVDATSMWPTANLIAPTENYTRGVHASKITDIDGRLYFWGDSENGQRLYIGGNPGNLLSVSPGTGGGFVDVEPGTGQSIRYVCKYKTQSGNSIVTMLCSAPNTKKEQRYNLVENSISISNEQSMKSWQAEQVAGAVGCNSYDGGLVCEDGLYSVSRYGLALTTMTMEYNSQIRVNYVSEQIKPVFVDAVNIESRLSNAMLIELDGVIYMALGANSDQQGNLDNVLFCYDIALKAWWTYTLDVDSPIIKLFHVDWQGQREGIGIITRDKIYLLPTTQENTEPLIPRQSFLIETAELSTQLPQQSWQYLSQLEFHFDKFVGNMAIMVRMIDMFGRELVVTKTVNELDELPGYIVRMRIDQRVMSYVITMTGTASFRFTHFIARVYTLSNKIGQVWGFDDSISHRSAGSIQPEFKCYNDVRKAIFT